MNPSHSDRGLSRRAFVKAAVAIGGSAALAACMDREDMPDVPQGPSDISTLSERQHAWNEHLSTDAHENRLAPAHNVVLLLTYTGDGPPTDKNRETLETALQSLERSYQRQSSGLLFTIGYSPAYFERFEDPLPDSVDLPEYFASGDFDSESAARDAYPDGSIAGDETYEHTFDTAGEYQYFCIPHEQAGMKGTITVE